MSIVFKGYGQVIDRYGWLILKVKNKGRKQGPEAGLEKWTNHVAGFGSPLATVQMSGGFEHLVAHVYNMFAVCMKQGSDKM